MAVFYFFNNFVDIVFPNNSATPTRYVIYALVAQWIEQIRPKDEMWVRFLPRAQDLADGRGEQISAKGGQAPYLPVFGRRIRCVFDSCWGQAGIPSGDTLLGQKTRRKKRINFFV